MKRLIVLLGVMAVSLSPVFVRLSTAPSMVLVLYRVAFATLILTPYVLLRCRAELRGMKRRELLLCMCSGIFLGLHFSAYFESLQHTSIAVAAVLVNTEAIFVTLGSVAFLKSRLQGKAWAAVLITFAGSVIVALADLSGGGSLKGNLLALVGAIMGAAYTLVGTVCRRGGISTTMYTYFLYMAAALTVLVLSLFSGLSLTGYEPVNLLTTLGMAVFCTLMGTKSKYGKAAQPLPSRWRKARRPAGSTTSAPTGWRPPSTPRARPCSTPSATRARSGSWRPGTARRA